jgi:hypothetical protein
MPTLQTLTLLAYAGAMAATLVLAAVLTPASWWKRPNLLAAFVLAGGTWGLGGLALQWLAASPAQAAAQLPAHAAAVQPAGDRQFVVRHDLNLRQGASTASPRLAVVPVGAIVTSTGQRNGDWWQVSAKVGDAQLTGWSNSLWLRRAKEGG